MLFLILSVICGVAFIGQIIYIIVKDEFNGAGLYALFMAFIIGFWSLYIGCKVPPNEYYPPEIVQETEIVSLYNQQVIEGEGTILCLQVDADNAYSYRVKADSECVSETENAYELKTIKKYDEVIEVETNDNSPPRMLKYKRDGKMSFWSLGLAETTYVFYVPEGSISREITLN